MSKISKVGCLGIVIMLITTLIIAAISPLDFFLEICVVGFTITIITGFLFVSISEIYRNEDTSQGEEQ